MVEVPCLHNDITKIIEAFLFIKAMSYKIFEKQWNDYPFSYIGNPLQNYSLDEITQTIPFCKENLTCGAFPENITEVFYFQNGEHDQEQWYLVAKLDNGVFAYYCAGCDYTGFDCQGSMRLTLADTLDNLLEYALGEWRRTEFYEFQSKFPFDQTE